MRSEHQIVVIIPCHNEAPSIGKVVSDFKQTLAEAKIYVYDNNSTDSTVEAARSAGAIVGTEPKQGKGNVVRRMFADVEADIYVLVDGDNTYDASIVSEAIEYLTEENLDMVNIVRVETSSSAYRRGHDWGNRILTSIVRMVFGRNIKDMLSGYRIFSRRYVKSFPVQSSGFEIETELTVHALQLGMPIGEINAPYVERMEGSESKLSTVRDGVRILMTIGRLAKDERPLICFSLISLLLFLTSLGFGVGVVIEFMETSLVLRLPTALISVGIMILSFLSLVTGMILDTVTRGRRELKQLFYLSQSPVNPK